MTKVCTYCREEKPLNAFGKKGSGTDSRCRECKRKISKEMYPLRAERARARCRAYRAANPEKVRKQSAEWYARNKDRQKIYNKQAYENNREKRIEYSKEYERTHKDRLNECRRERHAHRMMNDPLYAMRKRIRSLVTNTYKRKDEVKRTRLAEILGCSLLELEDRLEQTCILRYGCSISALQEAWHIDHIIPLSSADTAEGINKLNHYMNLQILTRTDNLKKGAKNG